MWWSLMYKGISHRDQGESKNKAARLEKRGRASVFSRVRPGLVP